MPWGLLLHTPPQTTLKNTHTAVDAIPDLDVQWEFDRCHPCFELHAPVMEEGQNSQA